MVTKTLTPGKKWAFRLIAAGTPIMMGAIVSIILIQLGVIDPFGSIIYLQEPGHEVTGHKYIYDPLLGWKNIPNWKATTRGRKLTVNSKGLRDREYAYEKPPGVRRILVLGDSFTWGYGVADDEIFTEVLERRLKKTTNKYEVINTGVSGWGTDQEYLFLVNEGFKYKPDIVVLAFFIMNDPRNNAMSRQYRLDKPVFLDAALTLGNVPVPKPGSGGPVVSSRCHPLKLTILIIERMSKICAKRNCQLVVMKFGNFLDPENDELRDIAAILKNQLRQKTNTSYLDLDEAFATKGYSKKQLLEGNHDDHWNAFGHRVTGEILHEFLAGEKLVVSSR